MKNGEHKQSEGVGGWTALLIALLFLGGVILGLAWMCAVTGTEIPSNPLPWGWKF